MCMLVRAGYEAWYGNARAWVEVNAATRETLYYLLLPNGGALVTAPCQGDFRALLAAHGLPLNGWKIRAGVA